MEDNNNLEYIINRNKKFSRSFLIKNSKENILYDGKFKLMSAEIKSQINNISCIINEKIVYTEFSIKNNEEIITKVIFKKGKISKFTFTFVFESNLFEWSRESSFPKKFICYIKHNNIKTAICKFERKPFDLNNIGKIEIIPTSFIDINDIFKIILISTGIYYYKYEKR